MDSKRMHRIQFVERESIEASSDRDIQADILRDKEFITREDIQRYAQDIVKACNTKEAEEKRAVIVDAFSDKSLLEYLGSIDTDGVLGDVLRDRESRTIFKESVTRMRATLVEELYTLLDAEDIYLIEDVINPDSSKNELTRLKTISRSDKILRGNDFGGSPEYTRALDRLNEIGYIDGLIPIASLHDEYGETVVPYKEFETLRERMQKGLIELGDLFQLFADALDTASKLEASGLVLQDISPDNIGIDESTGKAIFFDIDGLVLAGDDIEYRILQSQYQPPETENLENLPPLSSKEMVYQLGKSLFEASSRVNNLLKVLGENIGNFMDLVDDMTRRNPQDRISCQQALERLHELHSRIVASNQ